MCDRADVETTFVWADHCSLFIPSDVESEEYFGTGGTAWVDGELSWWACSHEKEVGGHSKAGTCYGCKYYMFLMMKF